MRLVEYLNLCKTNKVINLFCDTETYQFNEKEGYQKPSKFKNQVFSLAVAYIYKDTVYCDHSFYDFKGMFNIIEREVHHVCKIKLYFHNANGYDNHYLLYQLLNEYKIRHRQMYVNQVDPDDTAIKVKDLKTNMVLEKRVKASTNLELAFRLDNPKLTYLTVDTLIKTGGRSLRSLGLTMYKLGLIDKKYLKSDFNYTEYNLSFNLSYGASKLYAKKIHEGLSLDQLHYIDNDVILLANIYLHFTDIYPKFDFNKITFSQNILKEYEISKKAKYQLTGKIDYKRGFKYSDYDFRGENFFDYLKHFYKGGLNFYNDQYLDQIIHRNITSLDINSSYPYVMYNFNIPDQLVDYSEKLDTIDIKDDGYFYLYECDDYQFNKYIKLLPSKLLRKLVVKYYSNLRKNMFINSNTIKLLNLFTTEKITKITVSAYLKFKCEPFDARDILAINYGKKTQGKNDNLVDASDPRNIKILPQKNKHKLSKEEIAISKVILNGIYGLPALRPYYNYFRYDYKNDELISVPKGFSNTERNELFSIFVTSQAFYNLLEPLHTVPPKEIDKYLYYGDTDSLYLDDAIIDKVDQKFIDNYNLGAFKKEHHITNMYLLNHKKYAFETGGKIIVHAGGVPLDSFNTNMSFEEFVKSQFHSGYVVKSKRNYRTDVGTIAIYTAEIKLESGTKYPEFVDDIAKGLTNLVLKTKFEDENIDKNECVPADMLYIETPFGSFSIDEIHPKVHNLSDRSLYYLELQQEQLLNTIKMEE